MTARAAVVGLTVATCAGVALGVYAGRTDVPAPTPVPTVTATAPVVTVTATPAPAPTVTVTAKAKPRPTVTVTAKAKPRATVTTGPVVAGPGWVAVSQEFADALAEGESQPPESATTRAWEQCLVHFDTGDTYVIVCPDGYVTSS
jgi:hypothetical protein